MEKYSKIVGRDEIEKIKNVGKQLEGVSIAHINSTRFGGGVAEILSSLVPLMTELGLKASWQVMEAGEDFFKVTKKIHNALQGNNEIKISEEEWNKYLLTNNENVDLLNLDQDIVIIHDPQPLPLVESRGDEKWIWRCHIDLTSSNQDVWKFLERFVRKYDRYIFHCKEYVKPELSEKSVIIPPSINPLNEKNKEISVDKVEEIMQELGIDSERPVISQVSRFDPWKGISDVIKTFRLVRKSIPGTQLVLVGSLAHDDPEGMEYLARIEKETQGMKDVHILVNLSDIEVNAIQRGSSVVLQMSRREGFGLTVTEAMWKRNPVIARPVGGIKLQVIDGKTGFLVKDAKEASEKAITLIKNPGLREKLGKNAKDWVKRNFLITRHLLDYLNLFNSIKESY